MKYFIAILLLFSFLFSGTGQSTLQLTEIDNSKSKLEESILNKHLKKYQLVEIDLSQKRVNALKTTKSLLLNLKINSIQIQDTYFQFDISDQSSDPSYPSTYSNKDELSLTINEYFINGYIKIKDDLFFIQPLKDFDKKADVNLYVLYQEKDIIYNKDRTCGVVTTNQKAQKYQQKVNTLGCEIIDLAIANDYSMYQKYNTIAGVTNHNVAIINNVRSLYRSEFDYNIEFNIVTHFIPTSSVLDPFTTSTNANILLQDFIDWALNNSNPWNQFSHDMGELWSDRDFDGSTIGLAQTPSPTNAYSQVYHILENTGPNAVVLRNLVVHEMGHNFSALHDNLGTSFIMAPTLNLSKTWSTFSISNISSRLNTIGNSLNNCSSNGPPIASIIMPSSGCINTPITLKDNSVNGETRTWTSSSGSLSSSTDSKPTVTFTSTGTHTITIDSKNNNGNNSNTLSRTIQIINEPSPSCLPSGTGGGGGLLSLSISDLSSSTGDVTAAGVYENFYCSNTMSLEPSTLYNVSFETEITNCNANTAQAFYLYIDYNNDNDFTDQGELALSSGFLSCGLNSSQSFTTPSSLPQDELFRVRAIVSNDAISSACPNLAYGQAEDYSAFYASPGVQGCTDNTACNYDGGATMDDGSCDFSCYGCINMMACNYDNMATIDDGSCEFTSCVGCMTPGSHNYDPNATMAGTCETCTDTMLNGDEVQVDCGGALCAPCPCTFSGNIVFNNQTLNSDNTTITSGNVISTNNTVTIQGNNTDVIWQSTQSVQLNPNFTINSGTLLINVEDCEEP